MSNPKNLAKNLEERSLNAIERFNKIVIATQNNAHGRVVVVLRKLKVDKDGYIIQNAENRAIIREANRVFARAIEGGQYVEGLRNFTVTFAVLDDVNEAYFKSFDRFSVNRQFMKALQKETIKEIETTLLNEGLASQIKLPLSRILDQNVNSGGSFAGMLDQVKDFIKGSPEVDGRLLRHAKTITKDTLFNYSRAYQQAVASDLGLEFYMYVGGIMDTTRHFCSERAGKFFHHKEIEQWAKEDWKGKRSDTTESSIFVYAGGHNCLHSIIPVAVQVVPVEVIERAIKAGLYKAKKAIPEPEPA
jgi:hypothetical protein